MTGQTDEQSPGSDALRLDERGFRHLGRWVVGGVMLGLAGAVAAVSCCVDDCDCAPKNNGEPPAFPGAQGFGARVTGGRGGAVIRVTTLDPDADGGLREALAKDEARIVVFDVAGVIEGKTGGGDVFEIKHGNVTIAGQTAPGAGITLRGRLYTPENKTIENVVVRHIRVRPKYDGSMGSGFDAIQFQKAKGVILDHVSVAFAVDENVDLYSSRDVTVQWSTIENAATEGHEEGPHNYGLIQGPDGRNLSVHHNLFVNQANRNPAIANGPADVINNVVYNARHGFVHHNPASGHFNIVGNHFKGGPTSPLFPLYFDDENEEPAADLRYFIRDNSVEGAEVRCQDLNGDWPQCDYDLMRDASFRASQSDEREANHISIEKHPTSRQAYDAVLKCAGAFPRDAVTIRAVEDVKNGTGAWGVREPADLTEALPLPATKPKDTDGDGIPDEWENEQCCLDPNKYDSDRILPSGYTAIEEYINELAEKLIENCKK
jgi:pectate lyase